MNPRAEVETVFRRVMDNRDVTSISYYCDYLVVDWSGRHLRAFTENGRGFNHDRATFDRTLGRSLLDGFLLEDRVVALINRWPYCCEQGRAPWNCGCFDPRRHGPHRGKRHAFTRLREGPNHWDRRAPTISKQPEWSMSGSPAVAE